MLFENFFEKDEGKEESGKFQRHSKLDGIGGAFGPVGVVCCGFGEDELEILAETVELVTRETAWEQPHVPIAVLGKADFSSKTKLKDVLGKVAERDSVLPDQPADVSVPLVLFSGFPPRQVSAAVTAVRASGIRGGEAGSQVQPLFAIAVPKAMDKTVVQLVEELEGDAMANDPATPPSE